MWDDNAVSVWVKMRTYERSVLTGKRIRSEDWELEAFMWPDETHPSGKDHLVRVSYLYVGFNGWIRRDRIRPR